MKNILDTSRTSWPKLLQFHGFPTTSNSSECSCSIGSPAQNMFRSTRNLQFLANKRMHCESEQLPSRLKKHSLALYVITIHFCSEKVISFASTIGDYKIQNDIFELILICYASLAHSSTSIPLVSHLFETVNFAQIGYHMRNYERKDKHVSCISISSHRNTIIKNNFNEWFWSVQIIFRKIIKEFNNVAVNKVFSFIAKDIKVGKHGLQPPQVWHPKLDFF